MVRTRSGSSSRPRQRGRTCRLAQQGPCPRGRSIGLTAAERARAAHQELTTRFGSHEIRTRLSVARGFVELIRDSTSEERTRSDAQLVVGELDKAAALNSSLLTLVQTTTALPYWGTSGAPTPPG